MACGSWCLKVTGAICAKAMPSSRILVALGHLTLTLVIATSLFFVSPDLNASVAASTSTTYLPDRGGSTILSGGHYAPPPKSIFAFGASGPITFTWTTVFLYVSLLIATNIFYLMASQMNPGYLPKNYKLPKNEAKINGSMLDPNNLSDPESVAIFVGDSLSSSALPNSDIGLPTSGLNNSINQNNANNADQTGDSNDLPKIRCDICNIEELPLRARHCVDCNKCVRRFDHHCPWVANCVAEGNHKFFLSFLVLQVAAIYWTIVLLWRSFLPSHLASEFMSNNWLAMICFCVVAICSLPTTCLMCLHVYLALTNQTTWEIGSRDRITYLKRLDQILPNYMAGSSSPFHSGYLCNFFRFCCTFRPVDWEPIYQRNMDRARRMWSSNKDNITAFFHSASSTSRWAMNRNRQVSQTDSEGDQSANRLLQPDNVSDVSSSEENHRIFSREGRV